MVKSARERFGLGRQRSELHRYIFMCARANARRRYVDRLTKKQRDAINFIKMLDNGEFVDNVGGKTISVRWGDLVPQTTIYILDC